MKNMSKKFKNGGEVKFFSQNLKLTPEIKDLIRKRIQRVIKMTGGKEKDVRDVRVDLSRNPGHDDAQLIRLEININLYPGQIILRAAERGPDLRDALDRAEEILKRQAVKYKEKARAKALRGARFVKHVGGATPEAFEGKPKYGQRRREE